jgi:DNA-binding NarL/FixJ family response regulator
MQSGIRGNCQRKKQIVISKPNIMNFFKKIFKQKESKSGIIFIVEDNKTYAKTLESFLKVQIPSAKEIKVFPVGETCLMELHRNPELIIIDYFLDSKYNDAETGLEIIKQIRAQKPKVKIIVLSAQKDVSVILEAIKIYDCSYINKDETAFERIEEIVKEL